jgi:RHS repeat-associated protein
MNTFAFPTSATNPKNWIAYTQFDYYTGFAVNTQDIRGVVSKAIYDDPLNRLTQVVSAIGIQEKQTTIDYDDANHKIQVTSDLNTLNDNLLKSVTFYDGFGRTTESRAYEADGNYKAVQTQHDNMGRAFKVSNPFRPTEITSGNPILWTQSRFNSLGVIYEFETPDGSKFRTSYDGNRILTVDQAGRKRITKINALSQLTDVWEITAPDSASVSVTFPGAGGAGISAGYHTSYDYDTLGNLVSVTQGDQTRTFSYDNLSRSLSATNPEGGMVSNTYDANGNLVTKRDARGIKTINDYDSLNRPLKTCYRVIGSGSLGAATCAQASNEQVDLYTSDVTYTYDNTSVPFSKGLLTKVENNNSISEITALDTSGRVFSQVQTNDGVSRTSVNTYNLAGALIEETYPSGRVVKNTLDTAGDLLRVQSKADPNHGFHTYADSFSYLASGQISSMQLGNGAWETRKFNSRLQQIEIRLGKTPNSDNLWKINYEFGELQSNGAVVDTAKNNGDIGKQTITVPVVGSAGGFTAVQTFTYDPLNRLKSALEKIGTSDVWKQTFRYDQHGNRRFDPNHTTTLGNCPTAVCNPDYNISNNRYAANQDYEYDPNGNVTKNAEGVRFVYNALNKVAEVRNAANNNLITRNFYDGGGARIKTETNNVFTTYVYDSSGRQISEYVLNGQSNPSPAVRYLTSDMLGSPRITTGAYGDIIARNDYMPFGEEVSAGMGSRTIGQHYGASDNTRQKFTGQIRDEEAKLDYFNARYYAFSLGRFTSPDSFGGKLSNPQSLNLYAYVLNNPLKWIDPTGHVWDDPSPGISKYISGRWYNHR